MNHSVSFVVNDIEKQVFIRDADTLLFVLREKLGLFGAKAGCENGDCGSCTVLLNDQPHNACHLLAVEAEGKCITTIEGLQQSSFQEKFIQNWAVQCGFCTPGFILNCHALLEQYPDADEAMILEALDSNICRCTGYEEIKQTVQEVMQWRKASGES